MDKLIRFFAIGVLICTPISVWFALSEYLRISYILLLLAFVSDAIYSLSHRESKLIVFQSNTQRQRFLFVCFIGIIVISFVVNSVWHPQSKLMSNFIGTLGIFFLLYFYYSSLVEKYLSVALCFKYLAVSCVLLIGIIVVDSVLVNFFGIKIHDYFCIGYNGNTDYFSRFIWTSTAAPTEEPGVSAQFLNALLPFALCHFKGRKRALVCLGYAYCLFSLFSTTGIVTFVFIAMVHIFLFSRRSIKLFLLVFTISLAGFVAVFYQANDEFQMYVNQIGIIDKVVFSGKTASDADRSEGMKLAVDNAMEAPLWGMGPGYGKAIRETGYLSTFLGFMGNYGFLGGFLFILFWITFLQKIKKMPDIPEKRALLASFLAVTVAACIGDCLHMFMLWFLLPIINKSYNHSLRCGKLSVA